MFSANRCIETPASRIPTKTHLVDLLVKEHQQDDWQDALHQELGPGHVARVSGVHAELGVADPGGGKKFCTIFSFFFAEQNDANISECRRQCGRTWRHFPILPCTLVSFTKRDKEELNWILICVHFFKKKT